MQRSFRAAALVAVVTFPGFIAAADESTLKPVTASETNASVSGAGLRAYIDPSTGRIAPPPVQAEGLESLPSVFQRDDTKMWTEPVEGKGLLLHTEGQVQMAVMARMGENGKVESTCGPAAHDHDSGHVEHANAAEPQQ